MQCDVRVLQVVPTLETGGLERVATHLCLGLRDRVRIGIACLKGEGPFADELRARGIPVFSWGQQPGRRGAYSAPFRLRDLLRGSAVQVVHTHNTGPLFNGALATMGTPAVALVHTDHARDFPVARRIMIGERLCARRTDRFVTVSEHSKRNLVAYEHIPPHRIDVIPNGVDLSRLRTVTPPFGRPERPAVLGTVARLSEQKALDVFLEAAGILQQRGRLFQLHLAGDGPCRASLEGHARRLGMADHVTFLGYRNDVANVLADIDVFVLSSRWEGMPLSILEAMGAGRPVVATAVGGVPEVVQEDTTGYLVPPNDPRALADALDRLITSQSRGRTMGAAARALAEQRFSLEAMSGAYGQLYEAAIAQRRGR